jgi:hypothetical protein
MKMANQGTLPIRAATQRGPISFQKGGSRDSGRMPLPFKRIAYYIYRGRLSGAPFRAFAVPLAACVNGWAAITKASATMTKNLFIAGLQLQNRGRALPSYMKVIGFGPRM